MIVESCNALIKDEHQLISSLANVSAAIHSEWDTICFWTGFYLVHEKELTLGPFQGPVACTKIAYGKGVCGNAWKNNKTIIVPNVHEYPGHIACNSRSNSEIVVPIRATNRVVGVLDIDSEKLNAFNETHQKELELICTSIAEQFFT